MRLLLLPCALLAANFQNQHVGAPTAPASAPTLPYYHQNDLPPRFEWDTNYGYCGETSLVTAGLYYGQYCSQYTVRAVASPGIPQSDPGNQLQIGVNDQTAATAMRLNTIEWDSRSERDTDDFLAWVKEYVVGGYPVIIGLFNNEYLLYGDPNPSAGDRDYDHIVVVTGIGSYHSLTDLSYYDDDQIYYVDNGLWSAFKNPPYFFNASFFDFQNNRSEANAIDGPIYALNDDATNYGVVVTGVADLDSDTVPVRVTPNLNYEIPVITDGSDLPPNPISLTLTVTVTLPDPNVSYNLYLYNDFTKVPTSNFNASASNAIQTWNIPAHSGSTYQTTLSLLSNEIAAFRAVRTSAP